MKHFTIPVFTPELACPFQCIYCNQENISGRYAIPDPAEARNIIERHLGTISSENSYVEVGFFGGNFTGLGILEQEKYLGIVQPYLENGSVKGIRLSTRPDYINSEIIGLLERFNVTTVELGAQSMNDDVLKRSGRGHSVQDTVKASQLIKKAGFRLGLQMMLGLPGDTKEQSITTAEKIVGLGADDTRIYPTLVIKGTKLEILYQQNKYIPLSLEMAVDWAKSAYLIMEKNNVNIIKVGLHPSEGLMDGTDLVAGPYHLSFRELVLSDIWKDEFEKISSFKKSLQVTITVPGNEFNYAIGYGGSNKKRLLKKFKKVKFKKDNSLKHRKWHADYS